MAKPEQTANTLSSEGFQTELLSLFEATRVELRKEDDQYAKLKLVKEGQIKGGKLDTGGVKLRMEEVANLDKIIASLADTRDDVRGLNAEAVDVLRLEGGPAAAA